MRFTWNKKTSALGAAAAVAALAGGITSAWASDGPENGQSTVRAPAERAVALPSVDKLPAGAVSADDVSGAVALPSVDKLPAGAVAADDQTGR
ncbi:MAG: hypothetical protein ABW167_03095 [Baekduia sp.]